MTWLIEGKNELTSKDIPKTAFGEISIAESTPVVQVSAQYGLVGELLTVNSDGGTSGASNSLFSVNSGTNPLGLSTLTTLRQLAYKPGQGAACRITALFSPGQPASFQAAGLINSEDGFAFGCVNEDFGIIFSRNGEVEAQELTITTPASGNENATVTINGTGFIVPLTAGTEAHNAFEIANSLTAQIPNFLFSSNESTVFVMDIIPGPNATYAFSSATAIASFAQITAGVEPVINLIKQTDWNVNKAPWLNPQFGNVYSISLQYLGFGNINFFVEDPENGNPLLVHIIKYANSSTETSVGNPTFRIGWLARNLGNTTNLTVSGGSAAGFVEGKIIPDSLPRARDSIAPNVGLTQTNIVTIRNRFHFGDRINRAEILPRLLSLGTDSDKGVIFRLTVNATFGGDVNFKYEDKVNSIAEFSTDAVSVSGGRTLASFYVSSSGQVIESSEFESAILPNDTLTLSAAVVQTPNALIVGSTVWQEDT